jgi:hypothetical protein
VPTGHPSPRAATIAPPRLRRCLDEAEEIVNEERERGRFPALRECAFAYSEEYGLLRRMLTMIEANLKLAPGSDITGE